MCWDVKDNTNEATFWSACCSQIGSMDGNVCNWPYGLGLGLAKLDPWFQPVIPFITKDSAYTWLLPKQLMCKLLVKDYPDDLKPQQLVDHLSLHGRHFGGCLPLVLQHSGRRLSFHGSWEIALGDSLGHIFKNERSNWHVFIICGHVVTFLWHWNHFLIFSDLMMLAFDLMILAVQITVAFGLQDLCGGITSNMCPQ